MTYRSALEKAGHEVTLIVPRYHHDTDENRLIRIPSRRVPMDEEDRMMKARDIRRTLPLLQRTAFDILHIQTPFVAHYAGIKLARQLGIVAVETYHTFFEEYLYHYIPHIPDAWLRFAARRLARSQCNAVDGLVVPSRAMLDILRDYGVKTRAEVIPTGLDLSAFAGGKGENFRRQHGIALDRPTLVHVGRIAYEKNIGFLLHMLGVVKKTVPTVLLIIAGSGPAVGSLKKLVGTLGLSEHVMFVGYLDRKTELLDCYKAGDVFVFSSRTETQGLVLLEAMALGVPVVSTAVMGTKDILQPVMGALVAQEDVHDFADKVVQILLDKNLRSSLGKQARYCAEQWSQPNMTRKMLDFYRQISRFGDDR